eukprot:2982319-Rhodomonas_salina.3
MAAKCFDLRAALLRMKQPTLIVQVPASPFYAMALATQEVRDDFESAQLSTELGFGFYDDASELVAVVKAFLQK